MQLTGYSRIIWITWLALSLVVVQGLRVHMHTYDPDPLLADHEHPSPVHFAFEAPDDAHPDERGEIEPTTPGPLKNLSFNLLVMALFAVIILCLLPRLQVRLPWRRLRHNPVLSSSIVLPPPLRAPPR